MHRRRPRARTERAAEPRTDALVLGRYRLRERLGAGGFGVVWRAYDESLEREVAVKRIPLAAGEDGERATREALASARLAHPAIVALYEARPAEDAFYLISELVEGETLARLIAEDELTDSQILQIGVALCGALEHAHERGVIHRDVKPQNVLVPHADEAPEPVSEAFGGVAKLTDFGGARLHGDEALTRTGDVVGTLSYMAPEQSEGRGAGEAADLYSLALVLYEALSGSNPVRGSTPAETVRRIGRPIRPLSRVRRGVPRELSQALDRALARAPGARGSLEDLREALEQALVRGPQLRPGVREAIEHEPFAEDAGLEAPGRSADPLLPAIELVEPARLPRRGLPRAVWGALALAAAVWQTAVGRPGVGLLALVALLPVGLLPVGRRDRPGTGGWLSCVLAPALGAIGLAGAFPAIAGQAARWRMRAALGALGYWWLVLAEPLFSRNLWLGPAMGEPPREVWEGSASSAATHVLGPLLSLGVLLGALLWAAAAALLPLLVRGRNAALDALAAIGWAVALIAAEPALDAGLASHAAQPTPRGAIVGGVLGAAFAVGARALRGPV